MLIHKWESPKFYALHSDTKLKKRIRVKVSYTNMFT